MAARRDRQSIYRKIYFYRIHAGNTPAGEPIQYDVKSALETIEMLGFKTHDRYLKDEDGFEICCWIHNLCSPLKVTFGKIKRDDLPQLEHEGELSELSIPEELGLVECVHVMFFPENIVGVEYNFDGPKISQISEYLRIKSQDVCHQVPVFEQLLRRDVIKSIDKLQIVRKFSLKVRDSLFSSTQQADEDLDNTFQAARKLGGAKEIEVNLSVGKGKGSLGRKVQDIAKRIFALQDTNYDVISGYIKGCNESGKIELIDLLNAKLVAEKSIPRRTMHPGIAQSELFYRAIIEAYEDLKSQILIAPGAIYVPHKSIV